MNRKKLYMLFVKAFTWGIVGEFSLTFFLHLDPPQNEGKFPPQAKAIFLAITVALCAWNALVGLPKLSRPTSQTDLNLNALKCAMASFLCAMCGLMSFLVDSPHLGSPWRVFPYFAMGIFINVFCILPRITRCQPTQADLNRM